MAVKIKVRRGTSTEWQTRNPILDSGEIGFEIDTYKLKIGNGSLQWNDLPYIGDGGELNVQTVNSDTTLNSDGVYLVDTNSGDVTITLPQSGDSSITNTITIKNIGSSGNSVVIQCQGSDQIEGQSSQTLNDGESYTLVDNKSGNFYII